MTKSSRSYRIFTLFNTLLLGILSVLCIVPFIHILAVSLSNQASTTANQVELWPIGLNINSYIKILQNSYLFGSFGVTIERMILGTIIGMFLTITVAYSLSFTSKEFHGRKIYVAFFFFSMVFSGGIIPYYILVMNLNLMDTIWALVLGPVPVGAVIILLNFFRQLPKAVYESAMIDGASHYRILSNIYIPLSLPSIATLSLMSLIGHWNEWFGGMIYMKSASKYPLQTYLYVSMQNITEFINLDQANAAFSISRQGIIAAQTVFSIIPILLAYPWLQKYIKTGLVLGSVKE